MTRSMFSAYDECVAKERWQKKSILKDVNAWFRTKIFAEILRLHSTSKDIGILPDALAAMALELYRTGTQKMWGTKDLINNDLLVDTMEKLAKDSVQVKKKKYWQSLEVQKRGKAIIIPLPREEKNGDRIYGKKRRKAEKRE